MEREAYIYHIAIRSGVVAYDSYDSFVVVAKDSKQARALCAAQSAYEGSRTWTDTRRSKLRKIGYVHETASRKPHIVVGSFNAG